MSTLAGALGRGLAGYAANRERAMAREEELAQQRRAEARQAMLDERQRVQMEAQAQAMKEQRERQAMLDDRMREQDRNTAIDSGLRDTEPTRMMGTLMSGAADLGGTMGGGMGATMGAVGSYGRAAQAAAESPTQYSVGGKPMVKAAESLADRTARMSAQQRLGERMTDREADAARDAQNFAQQKELARYTRSLQPRPERQPVTQMGNDGNMYYSEDGGRSWQQSRVAGGAGPTPDRAATTEVPMPRPALDSMPGSGFSRSFTAPQAQGAPAGGSSPQQPAQPPRGVFGKAPDTGMSDAERKSFNEAEVASRQLVTMLNQYKAALAQNGTAMFDGSDPKRNAMSSLQRQILALYKGPAFANLGVLAGPDMELLDQIVSPATGMMAKAKGTEGITAQINEVLKNAEMTRAARHDVLGVPYKPITAPQSSRPTLSTIMGAIR
jgi:hypothetical protein